MISTPFGLTRRRRVPRGVKAVGRVLTKSYFCIGALTVASSLAACATSEPLGGPLVAEVAAPTPRAALQRIASGAARCWTGGEIGRYAVIPELDTSAGTPRILLIEKGKTGALPSLVIEAQASPTRLRSFGPLAATELSGRINADVIRWSTGQAGCGGRA